jgi:hypothetical protein
MAWHERNALISFARRLVIAFLSLSHYGCPSPTSHFNIQPVILLAPTHAVYIPHRHLSVLSILHVTVDASRRFLRLFPCFFTAIP